MKLYIFIKKELEAITSIYICYKAYNRKKREYNTGGQQTVISMFLTRTSKLDPTKKFQK